MTCERRGGRRRGRAVEERGRAGTLNSSAGGECRRGGHCRSLEPAGLGSTEGDGEPDELVSGIPKVSPRRQRVGEDRQARRPPDGRDAVPDRQRPAANEDRAQTGFTVEAGTPFRARCLDGLTTNWAFPGERRE